MRKDATGFNPFVQEVIGNLITVSAVFNTAEGDDKARKVTVQAINAEVKTPVEKRMTRGSQQSWILQRSLPGPIAIAFDVSVDQNQTSIVLPIITEKPVVQAVKKIVRKDETLYKVNGKDTEYEAGANVNYNPPDGPQTNRLCYQAPVGFKIVPKSDILVWRQQNRAAMGSGRDDANSNNEHVCYNLWAHGDQNSRGSGIAQIRLRVETDEIEYVDLK
jgi:hypothetical protein